MTILGVFIKKGSTEKKHFPHLFTQLGNKWTVTVNIILHPSTIFVHTKEKKGCVYFEYKNVLFYSNGEPLVSEKDLLQKCCHIQYQKSTPIPLILLSFLFLFCYPTKKKPFLFYHSLALVFPHHYHYKFIIVLLYYLRLLDEKK